MPRIDIVELLDPSRVHQSTMELRTGGPASSSGAVTAAVRAETGPRMTTLLLVITTSPMKAFT